MLRKMLLAATAATLVACASGHVLTGTPRAPIDPSQVRVYYAPPPGGYEEIALLEGSSGPFTYGEQNKLESAIGKMRVQAAKLGANGILFQGTEDARGGGSGVSVGAGGGHISGGRGGSFTSTGVGVGVNISPTQKFARGVAVYVPNPPPGNAPGN